MLSKSSLRDASSNGGVHPQGQPGADVGTTSLSLPRPPVMGRTRSRPSSPGAMSGGAAQVGSGAAPPPYPRHQQRADEAKETQAAEVVADDSIRVPPSEQQGLDGVWLPQKIACTLVPLDNTPAVPGESSI